MKLEPLSLSTACVMLVCTAPAQAQTRYSYSNDGSEVIDSQSRLVWRRCAEGMAWSGATCVGTANLYTHEQALVQAQTEGGWRLPNVKELSSLSNTAYYPAIDGAAFPNTPLEKFWTSTPFASWSLQYSDGHFDWNFAWSVRFTSPVVEPVLRTSKFAVRLVRR